MTVIKFYFTRTIFDCRFFEEFENNLMKTVMTYDLTLAVF